MPPKKPLAFTPSRYIGRMKQLAAEMTDEELELGTFFDMSNDLFAIANKDGYFLRVNKQWTSLLGWSEQELLSVPFYEFVHPEDVPRTVQTVAKMNGSPVKRFVNRYRSRDGSYRVLEWTASRMIGGRTYAVARDITDLCDECPVNRSCPHLKDHQHAAKGYRS